MTQDELDALPTLEEGFGIVEEEIEGRIVRRPFLMSTVGALFMREDDGRVKDLRGQWWQTGWHDGVRYKRRVR